MRLTLLSTALLICLPGLALAKVPFFNATCGGGIEVHADEGGPVYINGKQTKLKKVNNTYYEATAGHDTISIAINDDESLTLSWTGKGGANGICQER